MGDLNDVVEFFVEGIVKETRTVEQKKLIKDALTKKIIDEVNEQITEEEKSARMKKLRKLENEERARLKRGRIATFILDAVLLAFLIGLAVNQITNLLEQMQKGLNWNVIIFSTVLLILLFIIITWLLFVQMGISLKSEESLHDK